MVACSPLNGSTYVTVPPNRYNFSSVGAASRFGMNRTIAEPVPPAATVIPPVSTSSPSMSPAVPRKRGSK